MNQGLRRRRFLQMASALGLGAELGPWAKLEDDHSATGRRGPASSPRWSSFAPRSSPSCA